MKASGCARACPGADGRARHGRQFAAELRRRADGGRAVEDPALEEGERQRTARRTIGRSWARGPADDTFPDGLDPALNDQLERTRKLQAEGLEGLLPRAGQLLALGSTFWLGLFPVVLVVGGACVLLYQNTGEFFIHRGGAAPPPYVSPYRILDEESAAGPTVPLYPGPGAAEGPPTRDLLKPLPDRD